MYLCGPIGIVLIQSNLLLWSKYVIGDEAALYPLMVTVLLGAGEFLVCHHTPTYQCSLT